MRNVIEMIPKRTISFKNTKMKIKIKQNINTDCANKVLAHAIRKVYCMVKFGHRYFFNKSIYLGADVSLAF